MKILLLAGDYPAVGHQSLVFVQQLVHAMVDFGVQVTVVAPQSIIHSLVHKQKLLPRKTIANTESGVEYVIYRPVVLSFGNIGMLRPISDWYNRRTISHKVASLKYDVIYSHFWSSAMYIYKYAYEYNIPLFVACGEGDNALEDMMLSMNINNRNKLSSSVTGVISVSSENKRKCIDYGLANEDKIIVLPNCVNTEFFHKADATDVKHRLCIRDNDFVIAFVGGFIPRKGPDRIAKALKMLNDPEIKVMFIGKPFPGYPYEFDCPGIIHKGPIDHDLLPEYLNCASVFVMPTQNEGCCNAIVEALAIGLPVISSNGPFNDDILDENNSIRINPDSVEEIASAIKFLKDNLSLRMQMSEYSLSHHSQYSIKERAKRIYDFILQKANLI